MRIIHVPFCFFPDPVGGTEIYVANLARDLRQLGAEAVIAAPGESTTSYMHGDVAVYRFAIGKVDDVSEIYGSGDRIAAAEFAKIVDDVQPDLVHVHAFTAAVSLRLIKVAKGRGIPVVFTYHTPTVTCSRGTLLLNGEQPCDGKLDVKRCASCVLNGLGMNSWLARQIGALPPVFGEWLAEGGLRGRVGTALRMSQLIGMRHSAFQEMTANVDHIVAVCDWVRQLLLINHVPAHKLSVSRHGITWPLTQIAGSKPDHPLDNEIRIAFLGRLDRTKGVEVLLRALALQPELKITLHIYGVVQSGGEGYKNELVALAKSDSRISFCEPIPSQQVIPRLRGYDFLAIPSQWFETGPLVALEAFAAGVPVIGWNLGGIAEIVQHGVDGLLIEPTGGVSAWAETFKRLAEDPTLRGKLKRGVRPPRGSMEVAREMLALYEDCSRKVSLNTSGVPSDLSGNGGRSSAGGPSVL